MEEVLGVLINVPETAGSTLVVSCPGEAVLEYIVVVRRRVSV